MKKVTKEELVQKLYERWAEENQLMLEDLDELAERINFFNLKWGTSLGVKDIL